MILEITGSRVVSPFVGTSIFVWTSLIGVVLGSLSAGYWWGGKIADKNPNYKTLSLIIFAGGILVGLIAFVKSTVLAVFQLIIPDIPTRAIISISLLFIPANFVLGIVSPYAVRLKITTLKKAGSTVGSLYAVSTIGSIAGTFLAGFFLISFLGNTKILLFLALLLVITSIFVHREGIPKLKTGMIIFLAICIFSTGIVDDYYGRRGFFDKDTKYNRVWIFNTLDEESGKKIRALLIDPLAVQSAMFMESDELVFDYLKFYDLSGHFKKEINKSLLIGGAAYSYPKYYLSKYPQAEIDVVEIDSELTNLAKTFFSLKENPRLTIYHEDGRTFINSSKDKYDAVFIDAFSSAFSIPYQLTTKEAVFGVYNLLEDDGVVLVNLISSLEGKKGKFLRAEYLTYKEIFPQVYLFPVKDKGDPYIVQNIVLIALKSQMTASFENNNPELNDYLNHLWKKDVQRDVSILTDDYAPVDWYMKDLI